MNVRILHIEDDEADRLLVARFLKGLCELVQVATLHEALVASTQIWTAVLCDRALPECEDAPTRISQLLPAGVPLIVLSGAPLEALEGYKRQGVLVFSKDWHRELAQEYVLDEVTPALSRIADLFEGAKHGGGHDRP